MDLDMPIPGRRTGVAAQESPIADGGFSPPVVPGTLEIKNSGAEESFFSPPAPVAEEGIAGVMRLVPQWAAIRPPPVGLAAGQTGFSPLALPTAVSVMLWPEFRRSCLPAGAHFDTVVI